ncbi:alpha/beta fold hydrolase [Cellulomonas cellasea]|uniref:Alpha/beta hydrolase n=2 Tax=Cellulomonas cellasea TaxID=43670 RepID=A0A0A0B1F9_9CELL|nr:alpha/beta hydrolase [Cellulomonas cellasea]KGM00660.1 alpha/beta hydrolase [Cellulomonas cellasea DSM 20118]GEA88053.1 alpha/beta hydrolase [Cellulomonas cellasea]
MTTTGTRHEVLLDDGRTLVVHDTGPTAGAGDALALVWHHGSPQTGALLDPLVRATAPRGIRLVSYGRPSYGGSSPLPGRDVASAGRDVEQLADALGLGRFAVMGSSGGGPHALACAAALGPRVAGVATFASPAPYDGDERWFAGMADDAALRASTLGRDARARFELTAEFDEGVFVAADWAALAASWSAMNDDVALAAQAGSDGLVDDDVALVQPWGFGLDEVAAPVLVVHGKADRMIPVAHAQTLLRGCPRAELWLRPRDGHVSVLDAVPVALDWLLDHAHDEVDDPAEPEPARAEGTAPA